MYPNFLQLLHDIASAIVGQSYTVIFFAKTCEVIKSKQIVSSSFSFISYPYSLPIKPVRAYVPA